MNTFSLPFNRTASELFSDLTVQGSSERTADFSWCKTPRRSPPLDYRRGELRVALQDDLHALVAGLFQECGEDSHALNTARRWAWSDFVEAHGSRASRLVALIESCSDRWLAAHVLTTPWWVALEGPLRQEQELQIADAVVFSTKGKRRVQSGEVDGSIDGFCAYLYQDLEIVYRFAEPGQSLRAVANEIRSSIEEVADQHVLGKIADVEQVPTSAFHMELEQKGLFAFRAR